MIEPNVKQINENSRMRGGFMAGKKGKIQVTLAANYTVGPNPGYPSYVHGKRRRHEKANLSFPVSLADGGGHLGAEPRCNRVSSCRAILGTGKDLVTHPGVFPPDSF